MKQVFLRSLTIVALALCLTLPALADTVRLKDGSVIRGQIVSFKNEQFTILVGSGTRGRKSRITVYMEDVDSIEFDSAGSAGTAEETNTNTSQPTYQPPSANTQPTNTQPTNPQPSYQPPPTTSTPTSASNPTFFQINTRVRADNASNGWTNTGLVVRRGQRIRINASGRVSLKKDQSGRPDVYSFPAGLPTLRDDNKLMRTEPTGALIAVIGDDNDDFIPIGAKRDFVAQRDGVLFLGVNESDLTDNSGKFDVVIEAEAGGRTP